MADNYLEKKMEELRSGRYRSGATKRSAATGSRKMLCYSFRELRIVIVAHGRKFLRQYSDVFRSAGCRVCIINSEEDYTTDLGTNHGVRYYNTNGNDKAEEVIKDLTHAWHDIDVIVLLDTNSGIKDALCKHVASLPYPNDWGMPVITVNDGRVSRLSYEELPENMISLIPDEPDRPEAAVMPWLSLKSNDKINTVTFK